MGRTRNEKRLVTKPTVQPVTESEPSIPSLLEKCQDLIIECNYDLAKRFIQRILDREPGNVEAREMLGVSQLETGDIEQAKQVREIYFCMMKY
jgi:Flp pilus assembly protein TadD